MPRRASSDISSENCCGETVNVSETRSPGDDTSNPMVHQDKRKVENGQKSGGYHASAYRNINHDYWE